MIAISKIDKINKFVKPEIKYYCKTGDVLNIITKDAAETNIVVACEFKGERFSMRWDDLTIPPLVKDVDFELED